MKVGDLVELKEGASRVGLMVDVIHKKCWRTDTLGRKIDWSSIEAEPHAVVMYDDGLINIPIIDLRVCDEHL